jgi:hypothetical protein
MDSCTLGLTLYMPCNLFRTPLHYILFTYCKCLDILSTIKENWGYFCILSMYVKPWTPFIYDLLDKSFHVHFLHLICFDSHFEILNKQVWIWKCGFTFWLFPTNNPLNYHAYYHLPWLHLYHWEKQLPLKSIYTSWPSSLNIFAYIQSITTVTKFCSMVLKFIFYH